MNAEALKLEKPMATRPNDRWLQGRSCALVLRGLSYREALIQAIRDWAEQEKLEHEWKVGR
jgi:hypothetical protein